MIHHSSSIFTRAQGDGLQPGGGAAAVGLAGRGRLLPGLDGHGLDRVRGRGAGRSGRSGTNQRPGISWDYKNGIMGIIIMGYYYNCNDHNGMIIMGYIDTITIV